MCCCIRHFFAFLQRSTLCRRQRWLPLDRSPRPSTRRSWPWVRQRGKSRETLKRMPDYSKRGELLYSSSNSNSKATANQQKPLHRGERIRYLSLFSPSFTLFILSSSLSLSLSLTHTHHTISSHHRALESHLHQRTSHPLRPHPLAPPSLPVVNQLVRKSSWRLQMGDQLTWPLTPAQPLSSSSLPLRRNSSKYKCLFNPWSCLLALLNVRMLLQLWIPLTFCKMTNDIIFLWNRWGNLKAQLVLSYHRYM